MILFYQDSQRKRKKISKTSSKKHTRNYFPYSRSADIPSQKTNSLFPFAPLAHPACSLADVRRYLSRYAKSDLATLEPCPSAPRIAREAKREFVFSYNYSSSASSYFPSEGLRFQANIKSSVLYIFTQALIG